MGRACTRTGDRVAAAFGLLDEAQAIFSSSSDVCHGGVLLSLPALLLNGLLRHTKRYYSLPSGFYGLVSLFILLAFMALARIRFIERLRYLPPGELGKLLGLDRIPEVRTLRNKLEILSKQHSAKDWSSALGRDWMESAPELAGRLYVDGHIRVYHGTQTKLPRRYVARERLCLRGTTDYWINDALGQPFFMISTPATDGLLAMLRQNIVPRLIQDVPRQPTEDQLKADPYLSRFAIVFDREGYSPKFFKEMWHKRISCYTYHKFPKADWAKQEFTEHTVTFPTGEQVKMQLAERGTLLSNHLWIREIRKLTKSGHQTALLSTDYKSGCGRIAVSMFCRWSQENFFKYMREHFGIDRLIEYETESVPDTVEVINPRYRELSSQIRSKTSCINRRSACFGEITLKEGELDGKKFQKYEQKKAELQEDISLLEKELVELKDKRKKVPRRVMLGELPENERFLKLADEKKHIMDTIKMTAYRAETSMADMIKPFMAKSDEARAFLQQIFKTDADIEPDEKAGTLTVSLHNLTNDCFDKIAQKLCVDLTDTETVYPGTNLRLVYKMVSRDFLADQEI